MNDTSALETDAKTGSLAKSFLTHSVSFLRQPAMGSSSEVPSPSHRISRHAHHPLLAAGPCSGHTQASSGLLHLPSPLPKIPGHGKHGQGTAQFLASGFVLLGRGSALASCSICSHAQCFFALLLLTPPSSSYHWPTACISGWLSQLRLKQCWVTTIPRAQRPQAANTGFPHWRVHRWSGKDSSRLGLGLGLFFCLCILFGPAGP